MSLRMEFFRHCPSCGRRFHIKLVEKSLLDDYGSKTGGPIVGGMVHGVAYVGEEGPMFFDIKEFQYKYKHCGHEWSETRLQDKLERVGP